MLQWPQYAHLRDNFEVLLAEYEPTYDFIEKLIIAATTPFRSKRIHLGMDEVTLRLSLSDLKVSFYYTSNQADCFQAYGVGEGRYRQFFGYKEGTRIFGDHLQRVNEICERLGVQPMIWSDSKLPIQHIVLLLYPFIHHARSITHRAVLFCLAAKNNSLQGYYDTENNPANMPEVVDKTPRNIELIFWDYYHTDADLYVEKLRHHRDLGCQQPWMATGVWTWSRFWSALPFTFDSVRASTVTAKNQQTGVRNGFITVWGDDGNECDMYVRLIIWAVAQHRKVFFLLIVLQ